MGVKSSWCSMLQFCLTLLQAKSVLLVATRDIQDGEELFMDYRLSLNQPHPSWYHPVDEEATRRLWVGGRG